MHAAFEGMDQSMNTGLVTVTKGRNGYGAGQLETDRHLWHLLRGLSQLSGSANQ